MARLITEGEKMFLCGVYPEGKIPVEPHIVNHDDNWGIGQFRIDKIVKMIKVGREMGIEFTLAKKVTAVDDITWKEKTIKSFNDSLFVFPNCRVLTEFWRQVDA